MQRVVLLIFLTLMPCLTWAAQPVEILAMHIKPSQQETIITYTLNRQTTGRVKYLPQSKQVWVDFANANKRFAIKHARFRYANVTSVASMNLPQHAIRFIFSVKENIRYTTQFTPPNEVNKKATLKIVISSLSSQPSKVRVRAGEQVLAVSAKAGNVKLQASKKVELSVKQAEVRNLEKDIFDLLAEQKNNIGRSRLEQQEKIATAQKNRRYTIVIDAGHGGKDSGALGPSGTKEKTVVLNIAKRLAKLINQTPDMRAVLTRQGDYFVPLRKRLKLARKDEADLFIAIHADAYFEANARGASVYALSARGATSEAARWLAERDNYSELDGVSLNALQDRSTVLRSVLIDMAQTATIQDSLRLGNRVLDALDDISALHYKQVEQAPFMVLRSPDIPSILIETGFISNPVEEKRLADPLYQEKLARAIFNGLRAYRQAG